MNRTAFLRQVQEENESELEILRTKGAAYSGEEDAFANFKRNAEKLGLTKYQVWMVYAFKHIDAIQLAIKNDPSRPLEQSEGMTGRLRDAINYFKLLKGMLEEDGLLESKSPEEQQLNSDMLIHEVTKIVSLSPTQMNILDEHFCRILHNAQVGRRNS